MTSFLHRFRQNIDLILCLRSSCVYKLGLGAFHLLLILFECSSSVVKRRPVASGGLVPLLVEKRRPAAAGCVSVLEEDCTLA
ncbi:hypothetical protein Taro_032762 [Colocasia esculenta]|uniref:Uncharacterized protein n=1 Tax=Colocasia esculenta TaxID=4460 RepID=A0A843VS55_COLES|nr:hypothetical protein [Colocasia esculenta]